MTGDELRDIRKRLGLSRSQMARAIGYQGNPNTLKVAIAKYEDGTREPIPRWIERLVVMYDRHGVPPEWLDAKRGVEESTDQE